MQDKTSLDAEAVALVLETVISPCRQTSLNAEVALPRRFSDPTFWEDALSYSQMIHATLPFLSGLTAYSWKTSLPVPTLEKLEAELRRERMFLALLDIETSIALEALEGVAIPVILLKGADVSRRLYPKKTLRPMKDIDLLVSISDFPIALEHLKSRGYQQIGSLYPGRFRVELARSNESPVIELHTRLLSTDRSSDTERHWKNAVPADFPDLPGRLYTNVYLLDYTDCLSYLVRHAGKQHLLESPVWLNDIHLLIKNSLVIKNSPVIKSNLVTENSPVIENNLDRINWAEFQKEMKHHQSTSAAWFVLKLIEAHWHTPIPAQVLAALSPKPDSIQFRFLSERLSPQIWFSSKPRSWGSVLRARLLLHDTLYHASGYLAATLYQRISRVFLNT